MTGNLAPASNIAYNEATEQVVFFNSSTKAWEPLAALDPDEWPGNQLAVGTETLPRYVVNTGQAMTTGVLRLTYFTARRDETIATVRTHSTGTAAGATPTLVRIGLYTVAGNGDLTLVASTASDTTLYAAANTEYSKALSAPYAVVGGTRYAVGILVVTGATAPTVASCSGTLVAAETGKAPRLCGTRTGLSDLPSPITAGTIGNTAVMLYAALVP